MEAGTDRPRLIRIVLGSVPSKLAPERAAVERTLMRLRETTFPGLEWVAFDDDEGTGTRPFEPSRGQLYIGFLGGQASAIHFEPEYRRANQHELRCLIYVKDEPKTAAKRGRGKSKSSAARSGLASELIQSGNATRFCDPDDLQAKVATDLGQWLSEHDTGGATEEMARTEIEELPSPAHVAKAIGERAFAIGGDARDNVFQIGDVYQTIVKLYPSLKDYAIDFDDLIKKVSERFVGRAELFRRLDAFAKRHPCGYFRVVADAGLGKTAIAAEASKRLKAPAFFTIASRRPDPSRPVPQPPRR